MDLHKILLDKMQATNTTPYALAKGTGSMPATVYRFLRDGKGVARTDTWMMWMQWLEDKEAAISPRAK